jgi:hypothetical protein
MRRFFCGLALGSALGAVGCERASQTPTTGAPLELNKAKNAPGSYGDPNSGAKTAPGPQK